MIIDKLLPYQSEEERQRLEEIRQIQNEAQRYLMDTIITGQKAENDQDILGQWGDLEKESYTIQNAVEARYMKTCSKKQILADVQEIVDAIERADFQAYISERIGLLSTLETHTVTQIDLTPFRQMLIENYENCCLYIRDILQVQLKALAEDRDGLDKVSTIIENRVALWYVKQHPSFVALAHGKPTDALAFMSTRNAGNLTIDPITGTATINRLGVQLAILKLAELHATLGISTDKLLSTAIATFTKQNDFRHTKGTPPRREVTINLKEYASLLGYDVVEHETSTPEEAKKEKQRAKNALDNARKAIRKDLDIIHASTLTWEEDLKGKSRDFARVSLVTYTGINNGQIRIAFSPELAGYLAERNLITQYPVKLLGLDSRKPTAYYIGRKLAEHNSIDNNVIRGTQNILSIPAILAVTDLPTFEEVQKKDRGHWENRIKRFFEEALDTLTQEGILEDWEYTHAKGVPLTDEEVDNLTRYEDFAKLYLHFKLADAEDQTERIEAKQRARAEAKKKKPNKKKTQPER